MRRTVPGNEPFLFGRAANEGIAQCMAGGKTIAGQIERLVVRLDGAGVCDDCIAERLDLGTGGAASAVMGELGGRAGFERAKDDCTLCGESRTVIRHAGRRSAAG